MLNLLPLRILVLLDEGSNTAGMVTEQNLNGYDDSLKVQACHEDPDDPESPMIPKHYHCHVVFVREGAVEVEIGGVAYLAMHINNVVGYLD